MKSIFNPHPDDENDIWNYKKYLTHSLWRFQTIQKSKRAQLTDEYGHLKLKLKVNRDQIEEYRKNLYVSTSIDEYSRILLIGRGVNEEIFSSVTKKNPAEIEVNPTWVFLQSNSNKKIPLKTQNYEGKLPGLCDYLNYNVLEYDYDQDKFKNKFLNTLTLEMNDGYEIELHTKRIVDATGDFQANIDSYVSIRTEKDESIIKKMELFDKIEEYFNFIFSTQYVNKIFKITDWENKSNKNATVHMLHPQRKQIYERKDGPYHNELLFSKDDLPVTNSATALANWIDNYDLFSDIPEVVKLLRSNKLSEPLRFTLLINALEATHRKNFNRFKKNKTEWNAQRIQILDLISNEDDKEVVSAQLNWANEINLIDRINDINDIAAYFGVEPLSESELIKTKNTRNYLIHKDESLKRKAFSNSDLYYINIYLAIFLKVIVLNLLELERDEILKIVETSKQMTSTYRDAPASDRAGSLFI